MNKTAVTISVVAALAISITTLIVMRGKEAYQTWMILKDVILTGLGILCIWSQIRALHPNGLVLGTGLALCVPTVWQHVKALLPGEGPSDKEGDKNDK